MRCLILHAKRGGKRVLVSPIMVTEGADGTEVTYATPGTAERPNVSDKGFFVCEESFDEIANALSAEFVRVKGGAV